VPEQTGVRRNSQIQLSPVRAFAAVIISAVSSRDATSEMNTNAIRGVAAMDGTVSTRLPRPLSPTSHSPTGFANEAVV
jgi:hypothetical protein